MDDIYKIILNLIDSAFHGKPFFPEVIVDWNAVLNEMDKQKVATFVNRFLGVFPLEKVDKEKWKRYLISYQLNFEALLREQGRVFELLDGIPTAVLKGSAASVLYPNPYLRTMGDIDILVIQGGYEKAWDILNENYDHKGYNEIKHAEFVNGNVEIELHSGMASRYVGEKQEYFDQILFDAMDRLERRSIDGYEFSVFPKTENGLILIRHMHQHMLEGIGLRHVVDWMAYIEDKEHVDWNRFKEVAQEVGIYKFLRVLTRMCEIYLNARVDSAVREWLELDAVDESLCVRLMEYVISRGNFGRAMDTYAGKFAMKDIKGNVFKRLQLGGMCRWKVAQEHKILRPFAWLYQGIRLSKEMLSRENPVTALQADIKEAENIRFLMDNLGLECSKTSAK